MKHFAESIMGLVIMVLGIVGVWEHTIIRELKKEVKSKSLLIDAQAVRARDLQEQIVEKDQTIKSLTTPRKEVVTVNAVAQ